MNISSTTRGDDIQVRVSGRIDALESATFSAELQTHLDRGLAHLTVDLADVDYLDSSGLAALVRIWRGHVARGGRFSVCLPAAESARRIFSLTGFDAVFDVVTSESVRRY